MAEKIILTVDLYDNILTEKKGDCSGKVNITGTIHNKEIAERIVKERTEYRLETIINILELADKKKVEVIASGKSFVDGVGQYMLNVSGSFNGEQPAFDPQIHKLGVTYTPGKQLLSELKNISLNPRLAVTGPVINTVTDSTSGTVDGILTSQGSAILNGNTLLLKGDNPSIGIYLIPDGSDQSQAKKVKTIVQNTNTQIIFQIPKLAVGQYSLRVTTQAGAGYSLVKEPRSYTFPILLTVVEEEPDDDDDDRPVIE